MKREPTRNPRKLILLGVFVAALFVYPAFNGKVQAAIWHLYYGDMVRIANYDVPVPKDWVAQNNRGVISLLDLQPGHEKHSFSSFISFAVIPQIKDRALASSIRDEYRKSQAIDVSEQRTIRFGDEEADCVVDNEVNSLLPNPDESMITITCDSTADLHIVFNGDKEDVDTVFSVLSQLRKHND